jgi:hypothetical protein
MLKVEKSIFIKKTLAEVFAFMTAEGNYTIWQPAVTQVIEGGLRNMVGSRFTEVRKFMGREMRATYKITEYIPNQKWTGKVGDGPVTYGVTNTYETTESE